MLKLNRRQAVRLGIGASCALASLPLTRRSLAKAQDIAPEPPPAPLGRVTTDFLNVRSTPSAAASQVDQVYRDAIIPLLEQVIGQQVTNNPIWYRTYRGYVYSSFVQPIQEITNTPDPAAAENGFWGEVTVAYADARNQPDPSSLLIKRLYYSGVFHVVGAAQGADGQWWYRLQEGISYVPGPYAPASAIRRIPPEELQPISPHIPPEAKRIEVNLDQQLLTAFEGDNPVLTARVSSGYGDWGTPVGDHRVLFKYMTQRMTGGIENTPDFYDLPGVAFPTFLTWNGVAIHATYWHNDYGTRRSHGCLNVTPDVAKWVWRWTAPAAPYDAWEFFTPKGTLGTRVIVA